MRALEFRRHVHGHTDHYTCHPSLNHGATRRPGCDVNLQEGGFSL